MKCEICNRNEVYLHQMNNLSFCENCRLNDSRKLKPQSIFEQERIFREGLNISVPSNEELTQPN